MLKIKSRFNEFQNSEKEYYTTEDLAKLYANLIQPDIVTFPKNNTRNFGYGFTADIANKVADKISVDLTSTVLVINDIQLQMANKLLDVGFKKENIYLAFGKWTKDASVQPSFVYEVMSDFIVSNFEDDLNIVKLEEVFTMGIKFDLIIANPPYGKIGANITKKIIDNIDFDEYVNLLPANDYKRNDTKDLFNYQSDMISIKDGFADAAVTTHLARIYKTKVNDLTLDEFERSNYTDRILDKYFAENSKRKHYAIDDAQARPKWTDKIKSSVTVANSFIIHMRDANHGYIPNDTSKTKIATSVRWNLLKELNLDYLHEHYWQNDTQSVYGFITFKTELERDNFTTFMLKTGWTFMCKVLKAMNVDSSVGFNIYLPKVDWTRSWTVEEILADYGYTETEIQEVMDDLVNYKGMED